MLLISLVIIAFLFWRSDLFVAIPTATSTAAGNSVGTYVQGSTPIQQDLNAIGQAQQAKQQLENQSKQEMQSAGY